MDKKTKIIIVDDHTLVSNALAVLINGIEEFDVAYQLKNGKELMDKLNIMNELPHIILLDINMPVMNGFESMEILSREYQEIKVLALSMNDDEISIIKMIGMEKLIIHQLEMLKRFQMENISTLLI